MSVSAAGAVARQPGAAAPRASTAPAHRLQALRLAARVASSCAKSRCSRAAFAAQHHRAVLGHDGGHRPGQRKGLAPARRPAGDGDHRHAGARPGAAAPAAPPARSAPSRVSVSSMSVSTPRSGAQRGVGQLLQRPHAFSGSCEPVSHRPGARPPGLDRAQRMAAARISDNGGFIRLRRNPMAKDTPPPRAAAAARQDAAAAAQRAGRGRAPRCRPATPRRALGPRGHRAARGARRPRWASRTRRARRCATCCAAPAGRRRRDARGAEGHLAGASPDDLEALRRALFEQRRRQGPAPGRPRHGAGAATGAKAATRTRTCCRARPTRRRSTSCRSNC